MSLLPKPTKLDKACSSASLRMDQLAWPARKKADAAQSFAVLTSSGARRLSQMQVDTAKSKDADSRNERVPSVRTYTTHA